MCCLFIFCGLSYCLFCQLFLLIMSKTEKQSESQIEDATLGSLAKDQKMTKKKKVSKKLGLRALLKPRRWCLMPRALTVYLQLGESVLCKQVRRLA